MQDCSPRRFTLLSSGEGKEIVYCTIFLLIEFTKSIHCIFNPLYLTSGNAPMRFENTQLFTQLRGEGGGVALGYPGYPTPLNPSFSPLPSSPEL